MSDHTDDPFQVDPTPDGPDKEANAKALEAQLQGYYKAIEEEWEDGEAYKTGVMAPDEIREKTKDLLTNATPKAVASMLYLSQHAVNESVKLKAAQYIIDKAIGKEIGGLVGDPVEELMKALNKKESTE